MMTSVVKSMFWANWATTSGQASVKVARNSAPHVRVAKALTAVGWATEFWVFMFVVLLANLVL
jgi:hypothetical protein